MREAELYVVAKRCTDRFNIGREAREDSRGGFVLMFIGCLKSRAPPGFVAYGAYQKIQCVSSSSTWDAQIRDGLPS